MHLVDSRHLNLASDQLIKAFLESFKDESQMIFTVFTKVDKLKQKQKQALLAKYPEAILSSVNDSTSIARLTDQLFAAAFRI